MIPALLEYSPADKLEITEIKQTINVLIQVVEELETELSDIKLNGTVKEILKRHEGE